MQKKDRQPTVWHQCGATDFTHLRKEHGSFIYCMPQRLKMKPNKKLDNKLEKLFKHYQSEKWGSCKTSVSSFLRRLLARLIVLMLAFFLVSPRTSYPDGIIQFGTICESGIVQYSCKLLHNLACGDFESLLCRTCNICWVFCHRCWNGHMLSSSRHLHISWSSWGTYFLPWWNSDLVTTPSATLGSFFMCPSGDVTCRAAAIVTLAFSLLKCFHMLWTPCRTVIDCTPPPSLLASQLFDEGLLSHFFIESSLCKTPRWAAVSLGPFFSPVLLVLQFHLDIDCSILWQATCSLVSHNDHYFYCA
jgi:hypothetical protein